ncbi:MAG TPA: NADH-quinone oxidoreductase subunit C, partial [Ramlibacter sp.]|nr:NADH-quinone oxidoreductase subunit C [Ramlibacter sp.]
MSSVRTLIEQGEIAAMHRPWPRAVVDRETWNDAIRLLAEGRCTLLALWGEREFVHIALIDSEGGEPGVLSFASQQGRYPSIARLHAPAMRLERTLRDLSGLEPEGLPDTRAWLDHGRWPVRHPLGANEPRQREPERYAFLPAEGESLHEIPVGPVYAGIIEPGHFRFTANGETVVRLEERLGYVHKGIESLMAGQSVERAAT